VQPFTRETARGRRAGATPSATANRNDRTPGYIIIGRDARRGIGRIFRFAWNKKIDQKKYTQSCNLPIQGQCADAAMLAFIRVVHLLKEAGIPGGPVLWLHDEIVLEVPIEFAEQAPLLLDQAMTTAFAEVFPGAPLRGLVAARIGDTWAATKKKEVKDANRPIQLHPRTDSPNGSSDHADPPQDDA